MATKKKAKRGAGRGGRKASKRSTAATKSSNKGGTRAKKPSRKPAKARRSAAAKARKPAKPAKRGARGGAGAAAAPRTAAFLTPEAALRHWQGHRRLTRRVIEAFPEDKLFTFTVGGMRTFGDMALELLAMAEPMARGLATEEWTSFEMPDAKSRSELLRRWDESTAKIEELWRAIPQERFQERRTAFGQYEGPVYELMLYVIDNEVHHRGQGYVFLRALDVEPPHFWERA